MGARNFDDEITQVPSRDGADRYFAPNIGTVPVHDLIQGKWCVCMCYHIRSLSI